jgi:DNA-binding transcriptional MerR regulator
VLANAAVRNKSPEAFRTISEVATELDVPQHVLRFWEGRFTQIKPVKRAGGRRYYRPEDVDLLRGIRALLYREGFTIKGVQKILRERGHRHVIELGRGETMPIIPTAPTRPKPVAVERMTDEDLFARPSNVILIERVAEAFAPEPVAEPEPVVEEPVAEAIAEEPVIEDEIEEAVAALEEPAPEEQGLSEDNRVRLEVLLGELLQLKARLRAR